MAAVLAGLLAGCSQPPAPGEPVRLRLAHVYELKSPTHAFGTAHLAQRLAAAGVGLDVSVFPAAQLGSEAELLEQLVAGELELAIAGPSFLAMWHPEIGAFDAAYAFRDLDHMLQVAHGELMKPRWDELRRRYGVRVLDTWVYGSRHITSNRPIRHPDDLRGFRLRLPAARVWQASGEALGASPMPVAFAEVYMALQQGMADGQENPVPTIQAMGFHEVQKCLNLTGHIQSSIQILVNEQVWQRLNAAQQDALLQTLCELGREVQAGTEREDREILAAWREKEVLQIVDDVDVEAFRRRAREYFAEGFPFSSLYQTISSQEAPRQLGSDDGAVVPSQDSAEREETP
jgi:tripartite ATP-independent transporter DctP family solute receptor